MTGFQPQRLYAFTGQTIVGYTEIPNRATDNCIDLLLTTALMPAFLPHGQRLLSLFAHWKLATGNWQLKTEQMFTQMIHFFMNTCATLALVVGTWFVMVGCPCACPPSLLAERGLGGEVNCKCLSLTLQPPPWLYLCALRVFEALCYAFLFSICTLYSVLSTFFPPSSLCNIFP
jgi:hypothetical protein